MAIHTELRPDDASLPLLLADVALRQSNANVTRISGMLSVDNGDGSETWIGGNVNSDSNGGVTKWVGDTTVPGKPTGLSAASTVNRVLVSWNGTLHDGVPADFDHISVFVVDAGTVESLGDLNCAGTILSNEYAEGTILEVYAVAYDAARDEQGNPSPNMSEESDRITLVVERDVDMGQLNDAAADMEQKADAAAAKADEAIKQGEQIRQDAQAGIDDARKQAQDAAAKADKARSDLQAEMDANKQAADNAIANVDKKADKAQSDLEAQTAALKSSIANVDAKAEQVKADASKISQRVDADKAALDKSIASVDAKAQAASDKGDQLAGQISDVTTTVNGHTTKLGELSTRIEGVASDGQTTVKSLTSLQQTVTGLSSTVSQNTKTASDAMSKVSQVEQTANGISANLSKNYTTTADADEKYAAKTELKATTDGLQANITRSQQTADGAVTAASKAQATADGINATLSKDYQTAKDSDAKYSTKAELKATSDGLSSSISSVKQTADGAVTAASKAQQTADGISLNLGKNYATKAQNDAVYATQSNLKATSDSLTASINSTAKTAQSAVDKTTSLEANLNGFKTTVASTYTTKSDFDNLSIGGTNRIVLSGGVAGRIDMSGDSGSIDTGTHWTSAYVSVAQAAYVLSSDIKVEGNTYVSVAFYDMNKKFISRPTGAMTNLAAPWSRILTVPTNAAYMRASFPTNQKGHIKLEKGTKPTDWSPAPEDLQPAGDYATNSSLTQTANSITAQVTEVSKTATSAMNKSTTVEQTANGLSTRITAQGKTLDATTKTANEAKSTADSNKQTISQVKTTADGAVSRVSSLEQNLDGFESTVAKTYQPKDGMSAYATTSALKQTSDSITAQVAEVSKTASGAMSKATTVEQTANGLSSKITEQGKTLNATVKTANEAKSTADSNKTTISQVSTTASNALSKASTVEQNLNGFKTTVSQTYTTKTDFNNLMIGGRNLLLKTSVPTVVTGSGAVNQCVATYKLAVGSIKNLPVGMYHIQFKIKSDTAGGTAYPQWTNEPWGMSDRYNIGTDEQIISSNYYISNNNHPNTTGIQVRLDNAKGKVTIREMKLEKGAKPTDWSPAPEDLQPAGDYATNSSLTQTANQIRGEVSEKYQSKDGMSSYATNSALTQKANEITGKVQEVAKTTQGNTTTISQVSQKADKINTTLSQKIDGKADVSRVSSLEQNLSGFKTTVAQSYQPKGDYPTRSDMQSSISQTASSIKSEVANTYTTQTATEALRKSATRTFTIGGAAGKAKWVKLGHLTSNGDDSIVLIHVYSGNRYNGRASQNAEFEIFVKDGWQQSASATGAFGVSVSRIRNADDVKVKVMAFSSTTCDIWAYLPWAYWNGHYTLQGDYKSWQDGPNCGGTRIQAAEPTSGTAQDLAYDTLSTRSYVDQTAKSVALGVVQNYQGSDGSGLATKSDITAAKASITSTVASTYATKTGVTQEISSKITQNNNSLDVKFSTKVETQNAQNKANTADSHATNAQSRVGSLEDCINLTASGVRVGKRSNGKFTGVSALVNTNGTFDLLDASGNLLTRINQHRFQVTGDDGAGGGYLSLSQDGINITVQPTADTSKTYHFQVGKSGVGITAPDGSSIQCSASGGLNIETVKFGKIAIGAGGLQFTNDQGWGLKLSAAGWSIKWAGNHTLATGPKAGALYIDGHEIVTR